MAVRKLAIDDMDAAAKVHRSAFDQRLPWLGGIHTPAEDRAYFREHVFEYCDLWGDFRPNLAGFIAFRTGWIDHLYVLPSLQRLGIGSRLLKIAMDMEPRLQLWAFQRNAGARAFYEHHGFVAVEMTDGSGNDEREPDIRYEWRAR